MTKKFNELKKGDKIWFFYKMNILDGFKELTLEEDFQYVENFLAYVAQTDEFKTANIDKKYFGKSVCPSRYHIWATSLEEIRNASEKFIQKELDSVQKEIDKCMKSLEFYEEKKQTISNLLSK